MQLSLMTYTMYHGYPNHKLSPEILVQIALQNGIRELDMLEFEVDTLDEDALCHVLDNNNVKLGCYISGFPLFTAPESISETVKNALARTQRMGASYLMLIPGPGDTAEKSICGKMTRQQMLDQAVEGYRIAVKLASPLGIRVCFENTPQVFKPLSAAMDCLYILKQVPGLGFVFDTANFRVSDTHCDELAAYSLLKKYIVRVHIKDVIICDDVSGELCVDGRYIRMVETGRGVIPVRQLIQQMVNDGFGGAFAIEYSAPADAVGLANAEYVTHYCRYMREVME